MVAEAKNGETIAAAEEEQEEGEFVSFVETHREREICSDTRPVSSGPSIGHWASLNDFSGYGSDNQCHLQSSWKFLPHRDAILSMDDRSERLVEPGVQEQCS